MKKRTPQDEEHFHHTGKPTHRTTEENTEEGTPHPESIARRQDIITVEWYNKLTGGNDNGKG